MGGGGTLTGVGGLSGGGWDLCAGRSVLVLPLRARERCGFWDILLLRRLGELCKQLG